MAACNYITALRTPTIDKLLEEAGQTTDPAKLNALLRRPTVILYDEAPIWFFNYNKAVMAFQPWVKGLQANATELTHQYPEFIWVTEHRR